MKLFKTGNPFVLVLDLLHKYKKFIWIRKYLYFLERFFNEKISIKNYTIMSDGQKLLCITPFLHGKKHDLQKVYYVFKDHERVPDGVYLWKHTNFYQGKKHGQEIIFGDNEDLYFLHNYHLGIQYGLQELYHPDTGNLFVSYFSNYYGGEKWSNWYDENGKFIRSTGLSNFWE